MALSTSQKKRKKLLQQGKDVTKQRNTSEISLLTRRTKTKVEKQKSMYTKHKKKSYSCYIA